MSGERTRIAKADRVNSSWMIKGEERERTIIQSLVRSLDSYEIAFNINLSREQLRKTKTLISAAYSDERAIDGLALAVGEHFRRGQIDTRALPDVSELQVTKDEAKLLAGVMQGFMPKRIASDLCRSIGEVYKMQADLKLRIGIAVKIKYTFVALGYQILAKALADSSTNT